MFCVYMARASTAIGVSPTIKETVQKQAHSTLIDPKRSYSNGYVSSRQAGGFCSSRVSRSSSSNAGAGRNIN